MADTGDVTGLVDATVDTLGGLDIVVSNVSAFGGGDFASSFDVDILAAQLLLRRSLEHMADHDDANIVCIGSWAGGVGVPWMPAYAAVKAATVSMVKSLALEVARRGHPGERRVTGRHQVPRRHLGTGGDRESQAPPGDSA